MLARLPMLVTAVIQTTMIRDNMTAYSTAVGPSSLRKNREIFDTKLFMLISFLSSGQPRLSGRQGARVMDKKLARGSKLIGNVRESRACTSSNACHCSDADNDDQRQHHSVFNCCWSVFTLQKALNFAGEILHGFTLRQVSRSYRI